MMWFNDATYGMSEPPTGHDMNPLVRSHTIKYWKKALSSFMPNRLMPWNEISGVGNPTRSRALNDLIKHVKKKEARAQGAPSQARRSIKEAEFRRVIELLKEEQEDIIKGNVDASLCGIARRSVKPQIGKSTSPNAANGRRKWRRNSHTIRNGDWKRLSIASIYMNYYCRLDY